VGLALLVFASAAAAGEECNNLFGRGWIAVYSSHAMASQCIVVPSPPGQIAFCETQDFVVKSHSTPFNPNFQCPVFYLCAPPVGTTLALTPTESEFGREPVVSRSFLCSSAADQHSRGYAT